MQSCHGEIFCQRFGIPFREHTLIAEIGSLSVAQYGGVGAVVGVDAVAGGRQDCAVGALREVFTKYIRIGSVHALLDPTLGKKRGGCMSLEYGM